MERTQTCKRVLMDCQVKRRDNQDIERSKQTLCQLSRERGEVETHKACEGHSQTVQHMPKFLGFPHLTDPLCCHVVVLFIVAVIVVAVVVSLSLSYHHCCCIVVVVVVVVVVIITLLLSSSHHCCHRHIVVVIIASSLSSLHHRCHCHVCLTLWSAQGCWTEGECRQVI